MTWQYSIEWHSTHSNRNESIVVVTSKPRSQSEKDLIRVKAWTSSQKHPENAKSHHSETAKIVLLVQVLRGDSPIIGAKVVAAIKLESMTNNGTIVEYLPSVNLQDNGYGGTSKIQFLQDLSPHSQMQHNFCPNLYGRDPMGVKNHIFFHK